MRVQLGFIPKMWQPSFPDVPQIPYTFTPGQTPQWEAQRTERESLRAQPWAQPQAQVNLPAKMPFRFWLPCYVSVTQLQDFSTWS